MKTDPKYVTERFLAAFDAVKAETGASDAVMEDALGVVSLRREAVDIRRRMAVHMARRGENGRRGLLKREIAASLGITRDQVNKYIALWKRRQEAA